MGKPLIIFLAVSLSGAASGPAWAQIPVSSWQTIDVDPRFTIQMPAPVERAVDTDGDGTRTSDFSFWFADVNSFSVTITDYADDADADADPASALLAAQNALVATFPGAAQGSEDPVRHASHPGRAFSIRYDGGNRFYRALLVVFRPSGSLVHLAVDVDDGDAADPSIDRFFGSFAIRKD